MHTEKRVKFTQHYKVVFVWPIIVMGVLVEILLALGVPPTIPTWAFIVTVFFVGLALSVDIERDEGLIWVGIITIVVLVCIILGYMNLPVFGWLWQLIVWVKPTIHGVPGVLAVLFSIPFAIGLIWAYLNHRWDVTYNEWVRLAFFKKAESFSREEKTFFFEYPDLLEFLLLGAGSIEIRDQTGKHVLARIDHVLRVKHVFKEIDQLLELMATEERERHNSAA